MSRSVDFGHARFSQIIISHIFHIWKLKKLKLSISSDPLVLISLNLDSYDCI